MLAKIVQSVRTFLNSPLFGTEPDNKPDYGLEFFTDPVLRGWPTPASMPYAMLETMVGELYQKPNRTQAEAVWFPLADWELDQRREDMQLEPILPVWEDPEWTDPRLEVMR